MKPCPFAQLRCEATSYSQSRRYSVQVLGSPATPKRVQLAQPFSSVPMIPWLQDSALRHISPKCHAAAGTRTDCRPTCSIKGSNFPQNDDYLFIALLQTCGLRTAKEDEVIEDAPIPTPTQNKPNPKQKKKKKKNSERLRNDFRSDMPRLHSGLGTNVIGSG